MKRALPVLTMAALVERSSSEELVIQEGLVQVLKDADFGIGEVIDEEPSDSSMVTGEYKHCVIIVLEEVAPKGGQFFICNDPAECSEVKGYFDGLASLAGPSPLHIRKWPCRRTAESRRFLGDRRLGWGSTGGDVTCVF